MKKRNVAIFDGLIFDEIDRPMVEATNWYLGTEGYAFGRLLFDGVMKRVALHRVIAMCPDGFEVDHINGNRLDNRRANLRLVLHAVNDQNRYGRPQANSTSGILGVHFQKNRKKWVAHAKATVDGQVLKFHKRFDTKEEAMAARLDWCRQNMPGFVEGSLYRG